MLSRRESQLLRALRQRKHRQAERAFLVEGVRAVEDLLESPLELRLVVAASSIEDDPRGALLLDAVEARMAPLRRVEAAELERLAATETPQGVLAVAATPEWTLESLRLPERATVLVLDAVQDPGNFGTLVRTAEALGAAAVLTLPGTVDPWNPKAVRAAMGSSFRLPIIATGWGEAVPWMRAAGMQILVADAGGEPLGPPPRRGALVVGNEGAGVSSETRAVADGVVGIPLRGRAESLNVAAAAAILLHQLLPSA